MRPYTGPNIEFAGGRQERSRKDWHSVAVHVNLYDLPQDWEYSQVREVMLVSVELSNAGFRTTIERLRLHSWLLGPGQPTEVIDCFPEANGDFNLIVDDRADTHISSADGQLYLGWFPGGRPGAEEEGWVLAVTGTAKVPGYRVVFDPQTPARLVAATVSEVLATARRL